MARKPKAKLIDWPRCKTCKWWGRSEQLLQHEQARECTNRKKIGECLDVDGKLDNLEYDYNEGGGFGAGPEFGCVHHEEKA